MSERIRDLHPGHDRMTVDISVRLCRRNTAGFQDMPYSEVDDRPWIINSNEDTANTAMESEISSGLRPKKKRHHDTLRHKVPVVLPNSHSSSPLLRKFSKGAFAPSQTHAIGPNLRLHNDFIQSMLLMFFGTEWKTSPNRCLFTSNSHLLEELSRFLVNRTIFSC